MRRELIQGKFPRSPILSMTSLSLTPGSVGNLPYETDPIRSRHHSANPAEHPESFASAMDTVYRKKKAAGDRNGRRAGGGVPVSYFIHHHRNFDPEGTGRPHVRQRVQEKL